MTPSADCWRLALGRCWSWAGWWLAIAVLHSGGAWQLINAYDYIVDPGPTIIATKGEIWPKPEITIHTDQFLVVRPYSLRFNIINNTCDILDEAIKRYTSLITNSFYAERRSAVSNWQQGRRSSRHDPLFEGTLEVLGVNLLQPCEELPNRDMDEKYTLNVRSTQNAVLESWSIWGILRGLESFSQLLHITADTRSLRINMTSVGDGPRFPHRGLLLDTSRHFIPMATIRTLLDGMAYTKLNVFHWHIVDDQSFPWQSHSHPELSAGGAYHPSAVYTRNDTDAIVEYARMRGIRVVVELDTPAHTRSWGVSHPELLTECGGDWAGKLGPLDPSATGVYDFVEDLLSEISGSFPDRYVHLGGDEVGFKCWSSNANISSYMQSNNINSYEALEAHYFQRVVDISTQLHLGTIVWEEVFTSGVKLDTSSTIVQIWIGDNMDMLTEITAQNLSAIVSTCYYLDHLQSGGDWRKFYECDPQDFTGTAEQKSLVLGGEACMWSEVVNSMNVVQRVFPRACAVAEKLWSRQIATQDNYPEAQRRLEEHTCRMNRRGIEAQPPNGAGYCY